MSHTMSFLLYYLSMNPESQEKIFEETKDMNEDLTQEDLSRAFYTRAAIHEAFRLSPSAFAIARILEEDFYLSGYLVKAGVSSADKIISSCVIFYLFRLLCCVRT